MNTLWQGRFDGGMSEAMKAFSYSLDTDARLLPYDILTNMAWADALVGIDVLTSDERDRIIAALEDIAEAHEDVSSITQCADEDVHSFVERLLTEKVGDAGAKIHTGRSRNDQVMTDLRLYLRDALLAMHDIVTENIRTLLALAEQHASTIMPGYTHMQQAQPISLAHYLLSCAAVLRDDCERLVNAAELCDYCPLGSGALAGSAYPIDRESVATALGFAGPTSNSIAATSMRDECLDIANACATIMVHLSRYAEDFINWSSQEFGFVQFGDSVTSGSSMMPQKKNPDAMELIRGKSARVIGHMQTLFTLLKGVPLSYARDCQEDKPALFDALDQTYLSLTVFNEALQSAVWDSDRMYSSLDAGLFATELADYLVEKGVPFRKTHEIVGAMVRDSLAKDTPLAELSLTDYAQEFDADASACFDATRALERRNLTGGTGPESCAAQMANLRDWLDSL